MTHWDRDHYAGALQYFEKCLGTSENKVDSNVPRPKVYGPVEALDEDYGISVDDDKEVGSALKHTYIN